MGDADAAVERAVAGDRGALEELLREHLGVVCERVGVPAQWRRSLDPEDLAQVTGIEAILRIRTLRHRSASGFRAWLETLTRNNLTDAIRALEAGTRPPAARRITRGAGESTSRTLLMNLTGGDPTASAILAGEEELARLHEALERLPPTYRRVVRALDLEERDVGEVAAELERSRGAVYMVRARAHERLRELLAGG